MKEALWLDLVPTFLEVARDGMVEQALVAHAEFYAWYRGMVGTHMRPNHRTERMALRAAADAER